MDSYTERLKQYYEEAKNQIVSDEVNELAMLKFCGHFDEPADWRIGPFERDDSMTFKKTKEWRDPHGIGWRSGFLFNPSLIVKDDKLFMFYRAAPKKETLCSRIGLAVYDEDSGWRDYEDNPVIYPTEEDEILSVEDPKVYRAGDKYVMFYNGISYPAESERREILGDAPFGGIAVDMKCAVSYDLLNWQKIGRIFPREISAFWVKAAVIPRNPQGDAVKIGGKYIMYISEGCRGKQYIGLSDDMINWQFEQRNYLDSSVIGRLYEVACVACDYNGTDDICMDFFCDKNGKYAAGQARYSKADPYRQLEIREGGSLSWGGALKWKGRWIVAQGWDAENGSNEMYIYREKEDK